MPFEKIRIILEKIMDSAFRNFFLDIFRFSLCAHLARCLLIKICFDAGSSDPGSWAA